MRERIFWIDCLKVLAIFAIILLHVSASGVILQPSLSSADWWFANVTDSFTRWAAPNLVMISGLLLLSRPPDDSPATFYKRRFGRLLIPLVVWTVFYLGLTAVLDGKIDIGAALKSIASGTPYFHLWYLYMLAGLYFATPFIQYFILRVPRNWFVWAIVVSLALGTVARLSAIGFSFEGGSFVFLAPPYLGYFLVGYYLFSREQPLLKPVTALAGFVICGLGIALLTALLYPFIGSMAWDMMYNDLNPLVIVMSICLFCGIRTIDFASVSQRRWGRWIVNQAAPVTLGIYAIHPVWLLLLESWGSLLQMTSAIWIPVLTLIAFLVSVMSARVLSVIPGVRRTVR